MNQHLSLMYHQATLDLVGAVPLVSSSAVEALNRLEHHRSIILPAAVREWYSLEGAVAILKRFPFSGMTLNVGQLGTVNTYWSNGHQHEVDLLQEGLLWIMREHQNTCSWAIQLNASENPPVLISFDETFATWNLYSETFSSFVSICAWDSLLIGDDQMWVRREDQCCLQSCRFFRNTFRKDPVPTDS